MDTRLDQFEESVSTEAFALQNPKLLKVSLRQVTIQARLGSMVAYQGDVRFKHAGSGGLSRMIEKAATGEGAQLMRVSGSGEVFLADQAQEVYVLALEEERITVNGENLLAFDAGIDWNITRTQGGMAGVLSRGLWNVTLTGAGQVAILSDGPPGGVGARRCAGFTL